MLPPVSRPVRARVQGPRFSLQPRGRVHRQLFKCSNSEPEGLRVNKCFKQSHSRRQADAIISAGRVRINSRVARSGDRVHPGDSVKLDNKLVKWQALNPSPSSKKEKFVYLKYWKPRGVICTTDRSISGNVVDEIGKKERIFPVGRLDKDSTGLLLLTNDGRFVNALLRSVHAHFKNYIVTVNHPLTNEFIAQMRSGVTITTESQRDGRTKVDDRTFRIRLQEGRNRQIRKMCEALGYQVQKLHRDEVAGISLKGLQQGRWKALSVGEMAVVNTVIKEASV